VFRVSVYGVLPCTGQFVNLAVNHIICVVTVSFRHLFVYGCWWEPDVHWFPASLRFRNRVRQRLIAILSTEVNECVNILALCLSWLLSFVLVLPVLVYSGLHFRSCVCASSVEFKGVRFHIVLSVSNKQFVAHKRTFCFHVWVLFKSL